MDAAWAIHELEEYLRLTDTVIQWVDGTPEQVQIGSAKELVSQAFVVDQILDRVLPSWRATAGTRATQGVRRNAAIKAITHFERQAEISEHLGEAGPTLAGAALHPWIWNAARSLWASNHYAQAVQAAAVQVNAEAQNKTGDRTKSEVTLIQHYLGEQAASSSNPKLRLPSDDCTPTALSTRRGIARFAEGCFAAIRNPLMHEPRELDEQVALEMLAALSVLARWIDEAELVRQERLGSG